MIVSDACTAETLAGKDHLNIFEMVELFKTEQSHMEASLLQEEQWEGTKQEEKGRKNKEDRGQIWCRNILVL